MGLNTKAKIYIFSFFTLAISLLTYEFFTSPLISFKDFLFWSILSLLAESLLIRLPNGIGVSVGFAINLAAIVIIGPFGAMICCGVGICFRVTDLGKNQFKHIFNTELYKNIFNASQIIILIFLSDISYSSLGGKIGEFSLMATLIIIPVFMSINCLFMSILVSLLSGKRVLAIYIDSFRGVLANALFVGSMGVIIALVAINISSFAIVIFFGPLILARYSYKLYADMRSTYIETIDAFNKTMEAKDPYTSGHAKRVQGYAERLSEAIKLPEKKLRNISTAAILHDIGKIGINDNILNKPGKLTAEEFEEIKRHPQIGADIIKEVKFLENVEKIIRHHHERYDGKGYPEGLQGDEIPVEAAILSIADVYDAMTSDRPYRKALTQTEAIEEIHKNIGTQFDPKIAEQFIKIME